MTRRWVPIIVAGGLVAATVGTFGALGWMAVLLLGFLTAGIGMGAVLARRSASRRRDEPDALVTLGEELERARRRGYAVALVQVPGVRCDLEPDVRRLDRYWISRRGLHLVLPDTDRDGATLALDRLASTGIDVRRARVVVFPEDALTTVGMVEALEGVGVTVEPVGSLELVPPLIDLTAKDPTGLVAGGGAVPPVDLELPSTAS